MPGVETGQDEQQNGNDREELSGGRVLNAVVQLLPMGQATIGTLVKCNPRVRLHLKTKIYSFNERNNGRN